MMKWLPSPPPSSQEEEGGSNSLESLLLLRSSVWPRAPEDRQEGFCKVQHQRNQLSKACSAAGERPAVKMQKQLIPQNPSLLGI